MKRFLPYLIGALVLIIVVGAFAARGAARAKANAKPDADRVAKVERGDLVVRVVATGTVDSVKAVEVKSRVSGRLARLLVDEGDFVRQGQLIAVIDPLETEFRVQQDAAQLRGAQSAAERASLEIAQRRQTAQAALLQAQARVEQLDLELRAQPALTQANIAQAEAALASAREDRSRLLESAQPVQRTSIDAAMRDARANLENAERELRRLQEMEAKGYVATRIVENQRLQVEFARSRLDSAQQSQTKLDAQFRADLQQAEARIREAEAGVARARTGAVQDRTKQKELESARAEVARARAALSDPAIMEKGRQQNLATVQQLASVLNDSRRQLSETQIRAPISGVVTRKMLQEGELATGLSGFSPGTSIVKIEDRNAMRVLLEVNEIDVARVEEGMEADVEVDALPDRKFRGQVTKVAPASMQDGAPADTVVKYQVEILFDGADEALRTGMSARCTLEVLRRDGVLQLPAEYVFREGGESYVELPSAKGEKGTRRKVVIGASSGSRIEIVSDLSEGEAVQRPEFRGPPRQGMMSAGPE
jgi:HlyD family secretion protein